MIAAASPDRRSAKLLFVDAYGRMRHLPRRELSSLLRAGDLVVANDAATLPASLHGMHNASGAPIEIRLAAFVTMGDPTRFLAIAFGAGDHRTRTEDRAPPPPLAKDDTLTLGPLAADIESVLDHSRLAIIRFFGDRSTVLSGLARHGKPIQYAHVAAPLALWDVWTKVAADPVAFEPPSAGFALDWRTLSSWRQRGIGLATLTHAAGISSTGDRTLDRRLPFDEHYRIPQSAAAAIAQSKAAGGRIVAIGTTVVRALEAAVDKSGAVRTGDGVATGRISERTRLRVVDAIVTGVHEPGESHFELLRAFAPNAALDRISEELSERGYQGHEFGDSMLLERQVFAPDGISRAGAAENDALAQ